MKKLLAIVFLSLLFNNNLLADEYPNSWKMDILCKQGKYCLLYTSDAADE